MDESLRGRVLDRIQSSFPLEHDPYGVVAAELGATRDEVLGAVTALRNEGTVRRLGASFASKRLGYSSSLCALAVPGDASELDRVAAIVNAYPGVTHNYLRENRFNLWFTIIARGRDEIARILAEIQEKTGCEEALNLPATRLYKIRVDFSEVDGAPKHAKHAASPHATPSDRSASPHATPSEQSAPSHATPVDRSAPSHVILSERSEPKDPPQVDTAPIPPFNPDDPLDVALVRWAQDDIAGDGEAVDPEPFATAASCIAVETHDSNIDEQCVLTRLRELKEIGAIRRFGALVAHRKMGFAFNGMTVWDVPADRADAVGKAFAAQPFVSHCYARPRSDIWPYNLYAMVHARSESELDERVRILEREAGMAGEVLVSTREYKKTSMRYFTEEQYGA